MNDGKAPETSKKPENDANKDPDSDCSYDSGSCSSNFSSESEDEEISDLTSRECVKVKQAYSQHMSELEKRILAVQERIYKEKMVIVERDLVQSRNSNSRDYLNRLSRLDENKAIKLEVADASIDFKFKSISKQNDACLLSSQQEYLEEALDMFDSIKNNVMDRVVELEEKYFVRDEKVDEWLSHRNAEYRKNYTSRAHRDSSEFFVSKKKPVVISGPFIVYRLKDAEILEDWKIIKNSVVKQRRRKINYICKRRFKEEFQLNLMYEPVLPDFLKAEFNLTEPEE